jgi:hypothetical protein
LLANRNPVAGAFILSHDAISNGAITNLEHVPKNWCREQFKFRILFLSVERGATFRAIDCSKQTVAQLGFLTKPCTVLFLFINCKFWYPDGSMNRLSAVVCQSLGFNCQPMQPLWNVEGGVGNSVGSHMMGGARNLLQLFASHPLTNAYQMMPFSARSIFTFPLLRLEH